MIIKEVRSKSILSKSKVYDYSLNPYIGCEHGCAYCYAQFMKRFTGHQEEWGEFVDVKTNAVSLLNKEVKKKRVGRVWISGVCDPYQPLEGEYQLTRGCLEVLKRYDWPVNIQTKSPLVLRDIGILRGFSDLRVGLTVTTGKEDVHDKFEDNSPPIEERIHALENLSSKGINTFAMIAPLLPGSESLVSKLKGKVNRVVIDRMNYHYGDRVYKRYHLEYAMKRKFFIQKKEEILSSFKKEGIPCQVLF